MASDIIERWQLKNGKSAGVCVLRGTSVLNRMQDAVDRLLRQQQAGFGRGRSYTDHNFTLRQIIEKVTERRLPVIVNFIDFRKAFDTRQYSDQRCGKSFSNMGFQQR